MSRPLRVYISAGDPSGDMHGAAVVRAIRQAAPDAWIDAMGGPLLEAAGASVRWRLDDVATIGFAEAVVRIPRHIGMFRTLRREFRQGRYDLALVIDYPGFNLRLASAARSAGVPVLYYIAPQMWAWGEWRVPRLRHAVQALAAILPFEASFFGARGVPAVYVGHPLLDRERPGRAESRRTLGLADAAPVVGLFPGSRREEVAQLWPRFRDAAALLRVSHPSLGVVLAVHEGCSYPGDDDIVTHRAPAEVALAAANAALCKSGTTTLQAALADTPLVIAYRMSRPTYLIARRLVRVPAIGLVNLLSDTKIADEFIQDDATPTNLAQAVERLLDPFGKPAIVQRAGLATVRARLGAPGVAGRVADMALRLVA